MGTQRIAVVTEGKSGLGKAICARLAAEGCGVVAIHAPQDVEASGRLRDAGIAPYAADLSDYQSCETVVRKIVSDTGRIDILVNNAFVDRAATFAALSVEDWSAIRRANIDSVFNMSRQVLHGMLETGWGRIVNISSIAALQGDPEHAGLAAAQSAVHGFTRALALEVASKGITVNTISHGYLNTGEEMSSGASQTEILSRIPVGRLGEPAEVAGLVAYLCSDVAGFLTGANIIINGGQYMF
ncbi:MAG TPA: SDR family oxidoreductase [Noviherbaspirillum sp.]